MHYIGEGEAMTVLTGAIGGFVVLDERVSMCGSYENTCVVLAAIAIFAGILSLPQQRSAS